MSGRKVYLWLMVLRTSACAQLALIVRQSIMDSVAFGTVVRQNIMVHLPHHQWPNFLSVH